MQTMKCAQAASTAESVIPARGACAQRLSSRGLGEWVQRNTLQLTAA